MTVKMIAIMTMMIIIRHYGRQEGSYLEASRTHDQQNVSFTRAC